MTTKANFQGESNGISGPTEQPELCPAAAVVLPAKPPPEQQLTN